MRRTRGHVWNGRMNRAQRRLSTPHIGRPTRDPDNLAGIGRGLNAHWRVAKVAVMMAEELFEIYMLDNDWWHKMSAGGRVSEKQGRKVFVLHVAPQLLEDARQALVDMLTQPDTTVPQTMKDEIAEALIQDNGLRGKRMVAERFADMPSRLMH